MMLQVLKRKFTWTALTGLLALAVIVSGCGQSGSGTNNTNPAGSVESAAPKTYDVRTIEMVAIDYEPLPAVTDTSAAAEPGAARLFDDARSNLFCEAEVGDAAATDAAFAKAAHVVRLETWVQRVTGVPMEARTAVGHYDKQSGRYFLHAGSGGVVRQKGECAAILGVPAETVQVVARDIGGNFGTKNSLFPEFPLVLWASKRVGRPVKWTCERSEAFLSDYQGRDLVAKVELAVDAKGKFLAVRGSHLSNIGGYAASIVPLRKGLTICTNVYRIPVAHFPALRRAQQHHVHDPVSQRRPAGGDLSDGAAVRSRRRQDRHRSRLHPPAQPDRAEGAAVSHRARHQIRQRRIRTGDGPGASRSPNGRNFAKRRRESRKRGKLRGIGLANYIECTMGYPREWSKITVKPEGEVEVAIGTLSSGQGHETSFAQCVSEWLACRSSRSSWCRATPTSCRSAAARIPAAPCGSPRS